MKKTAFAAIAFTALATATATADPVSPTGVAETDTAAIQSAVDAAPGGTVTLASGTFALNAAIRITNGTTLVGAGSKPADVVLSLVDVPTPTMTVLCICPAASSKLSNRVPLSRTATFATQNAVR